MRALSTSVALIVVMAYAVLSGTWVNRHPGWYAGLGKPTWQPPDWVFGVMWPLNFLALGVVSWLVCYRYAHGSRVLWLVVLICSVALALTWAYLFYVPHHLQGAALALSGAALLTWGLWALTTRVDWLPVLILTPYAVWMSVAATLSWAYARLN